VAKQAPARLLPDHLEAILDEAALLVQRNPDSGSEIDFVGPLLPIPVESKYVSQNWKRDKKGLQDAYGRGVFVTRDVLDTSDAVWALPSGVFAWAIGR
jgi:hypothetical protein